MARRHIRIRGVTNPAVLEAMRTVPRDRFISEGYGDAAYGDYPLPIGHGQTISQPSIVAQMTEALRVGPGDKVLEVGTGSGYQAAILAELGCDVFTTEIIPELAAQAETTLRNLGYNVTVGNFDGYFGWAEHGPFDGIIVTAAVNHVPAPLIEQLSPGAALVAPIGPVDATQTLYRFTVDSNGDIRSENLAAVVFVPLTGDGRRPRVHPPDE
jgi:protein-L-isoaspartate(D-aspartate) O-methyltransferase